MRDYQISLSDDFSQDERKELQRNLHTLFDTRAGTQPADRNFGISWECLDENKEVSESLFLLEANEKVGMYETRVEITDILFRYEEESMIPCIYFSRREES